MNEYQQIVAMLAEAGIEIREEEAEDWIETPPEPEMGDFAFPCYKLAKTLRKAPPLIAKDIAESIRVQPPFSRAIALGPYVNFFLDRSFVAHRVLETVEKAPGEYTQSTMGAGETVIVEFSSTNIAKPFHIGHLRSTVIGNALRNIYQKLGYNTVAINHLGDYGTQFGMMIAAYKLWGDRETVENNPIEAMLDLYVRFNKEQQDDPNLREEARRWFKELETGNEEAVQLWNWFKTLSLREFNRVYDLLGIAFDSYAGESFYSDKMDAVIETLKEKGLLKESDGAMIVDLSEDELPPALIQKSDGSTLYLTRDLAAAVYRKNTYQFDRNLYVVGAPQALHFQQMIAVLKKMGYDWAKDCIHIPFGYISMEDGTMSTREGKVIFLEDVLNSAIQKTERIIEERNPDLADKQSVARKVGVGAVVFQELFNNRIKDYVFTWDRTLNFEGETGPYVQYTHARCCSVLSKTERTPAENIAPLIEDEEAYRLIRTMDTFPEALKEAAQKNEPYLVTRHLLEIARQFNKFYNTSPILKAEEPIRAARLRLVDVTRRVLAEGLQILGIDAPEQM